LQVICKEGRKGKAAFVLKTIVQKGINGVGLSL